MHPILVVLELGEGSRPIGTYGTCAAIAIAIAGFGAARAAARAGRDVPLTIAAVGCAVLGGALGAWLLFGLVEWLRTGDPSPMWHGGGLVFFGAVPGAVITLAIARRFFELDVLRIAELSAPTTLAAHAIGRLGCFFGGCCYGRPTDVSWAVRYPAAIDPLGLLRHPSPIYESVGLLALALAFALVPPARPGSGRRAALWLGGYCALRFALEGLRGDAVRGAFLGASTSQWIALAGLAFAFAWWRQGRSLRTV
ncbi:MAG: prolipoprotein diacylglyceryl transferase [Sandaracinaceae bacterium]